MLGQALQHVMLVLCQHLDCPQAKNIVIATGGQASRIPIPGAEHAILSDKVGTQLWV